tara:strand:- start:611 stop:895 length:285 start_codon:yes stop_codon:yes gene_type:complete
MHLFSCTLLSPNRLLKRLIVLSLILSFSACTSIGFKDLFSDYAGQLKNARNAQLKGDFKSAATMIVEPKTNQNNCSLNLLEKARLHYLANDCTY